MRLAIILLYSANTYPNLFNIFLNLICPTLFQVLLVGMGADEQLGGYARHRSRFKLVGICCLINPMDMKTLIDLICFLVKKDGKD